MAELNDGASEKARAFVRDLEALCRQHGLQLATSDGDGLDLWPLRDGEEPIHAAGIEEMSGGEYLLPTGLRVYVDGQEVPEVVTLRQGVEEPPRLESLRSSIVRWVKLETAAPHQIEPGQRMLRVDCGGYSITRKCDYRQNARGEWVFFLLGDAGSGEASP